MKEFKIAFAFMMLIGTLFFYCISLISAWSSTSFNTSLLNENLTFTGSQNIIRYLSMPINTILTNAYLNLSGYNKFYQEFANVSYTYNSNPGSYFTSGGWINVNNAYDGNLDTYASSYEFTRSEYVVNYSIPSYINLNNGSLLVIKDSNTTSTNITLSYQNCLYHEFSNDLLINISVNTAGANITVYCWDADENRWYYLGFRGAISNYNLYEEAILWNLTSYPTNTNLSITNKLWNYSGTFNQLNNKTSNLANSINSYLTSCSYVSGYCNVPFTFHSDSIGVIQYSDLIFNNYGFIENNIIFNPSTTSSLSETFILNLTYDNYFYSGIDAILVYNNTNYTTTASVSGSNKLFTSTLTVPSVSSESIKSFYFIVSLTNSSGTTNFNTLTNNQTISTLNMKVCNSPEGFTLNFTIYDIPSYLTINSSFEASFTDSNGLSLFNYLNTNENQSNYMFCINNSNLNFSLNSFISYYKTGYNRREYIIDNGVIGNYTQNIPLYLIASNLTEEITFIIQDQNYNYLSNALVDVQQWNVGTNTYSTIGMFTKGSDGKGVLDLETYNTWYRAVVTYNGAIVKTTDVQKISSTTWSIIVDLATDNPYDLFGTISHGLTFNNLTNITTFTWSDLSGYTQTGCLYVQNMTNTGYDTIYSSCIDSVSGTINYQLVGNGEYEIYGIIYLNDLYNVSEIQDVLNIRLGTPSDTETISPFGKVISLIIIGTLGAIGIAAGSIILGCILVLLGIFVTMYLGWLNITLGIFWGIVVLVILVIVRMSRRGG